MSGPQQPQQQPPQQIPTALSRFVGIVRAPRGTAMTAAIVLIAAELILPTPIKPS